MQTVEIPSDRVVVAVALHDRPQPRPGERNLVVRTIEELLLDVQQLRPHPLADRFALDHEMAVPFLPADVREAEKVERLRLAFSSLGPVVFGKPPELNPARFVRVQLQPERAQPRPEIGVQLHYLSAAALAAGNIDGDSTRKTDLVVSFAGFGVWGLMNNASWAQLDARDATDIHTGDFDGNGQDDVVINIAGQGIWTRLNNAGAFTQLHNLNSTAIAIGDIDGDALHRKDIIISFASGGVWARMNNTSWQQIHPLNSPVLATVDLQKNGKDDVIMNFPRNGTWLWKNNTTFELLHPQDIEGLATGRFDIN